MTRRRNPDALSIVRAFGDGFLAFPHPPWRILSFERLRRQLVVGLDFVGVQVVLALIHWGASL
ncbi:hypothetical protein EFR84_29905 [Rhizobium chutanense]|uniref:Uncharacterized protein n=1 Tax=Rhizobium chutanense TaxID=2035448 RepID=A0A3S0Q0T7_9HYPH|nr:hypothetical protein EFR84_29905 [Rhizobium chutanense]